MFALMRFVVKGVFTLVVFLGVAWGGWRWGDRVFPRLEQALGVRTAAETDSVPSRELADEAIRRWERFAEAEGERELLVSDLEVTSVLRHGLSGLFPAGIAEPRVEFHQGGLKISGRVARDAFPDLPDLAGAVGMLPDTVPITLDAVLVPFESSETALVVRRVSVSGIPVPRRFVPRILEALGRTERPGLPPEALVVPLPDDVLRAYVLADSLHLVGKP